jgi:CDP-glucose 4,6-dehydratase
VIDDNFWRGKKVFVTGHTGFKGSWLTLWLKSLGARVSGFSLKPPTQPNLFDIAGLGKDMVSVQGDVRDAAVLHAAFGRSQADIVFHLAAQPLVVESYKNPADTFSVNVQGTVNLLDALRRKPGARAAVIVTTDKCYENRESAAGYREDDRLGGYDPYAASKACAELAVASYRHSFFNSADHAKHGLALATARAGNVLGGGDWAAHRIVPDCVRAFLAEEKVVLRHPDAVRPWQHVLEPLAGYLMLAEKLFTDGPAYAEAWNFGPGPEGMKSVEWIAQTLCRQWGGGAAYAVERDPRAPHETQTLTLDASKAAQRLGWRGRWDLETSLDKIVDWTKNFRAKQDMAAVCLRQIQEYTGARTA